MMWMMQLILLLGHYLSIMRKQGDLGSKTRKERARKARAQAERCVSREALLDSFVPDVLNLTMICLAS